MKIAVYPGSFDPITNGHLDLIVRAASLFDRVIVAVSVNEKKVPLFSMEERVAMLAEVIKPYTNVSIDSYSMLTSDYVKSVNSRVIIRGLRAVSDFENEFQMAVTNKRLEPTVETLFMMAKTEYSFISSSMIKEIARYGGDISGFVPSAVAEKLYAKLR